MSSQSSDATTVSVPRNQNISLGLLNQKGGAGKTTTTVHLGGALAERGYRVLLIDIDPSGSLTKAVGFKDLYNDLDREVSMHEVLTTPNRHSLDEIIVEHDEFDVAPANKRMQDIIEDTDGVIENGPKSEERLKIALGAMDRTYDFILVDCEPKLNTLTNNALFTDGLIVPTAAETLNMDGFELLNEQIRRVQQFHDDIDVQIRALVINKTTGDGETDRIKEMLDEKFPHHPKFEIRKRVQLQRATSESRSSIYSHNEEVDWGRWNSYDDIVEEIEQQFTAAPTPNP